MFKTFIGNIKREVYNIYIDLKDMYTNERCNLLMTLVAFMLGIIVTLTYGSLI